MIFFKIFIFPVILFSIFLFSSSTFAQSSELKSANQEVAETESVEARQKTLIKVIGHSIIETRVLIKQLAGFRNVPPPYFQLQNLLFDNLENFLVYQKNFLAGVAEDRWELDDIKKLAADFKVWREEVYGPELRKAVDFILVFQAAGILRTADARFNNISLDLRRLRNSKIVDASALQLLLAAAGEDLRQAQFFHGLASSLLLGYLPATTTAATTTPADSAATVKSFIEALLIKIKIAYQKFLLMSRA